MSAVVRCSKTLFEMLHRLCHSRRKSRLTQRRRIGCMGKRKQPLMEAGSSLQRRHSGRLRERGRDRDESKAPSIERHLHRCEHSKDRVVVLRPLRRRNASAPLSLDPYFPAIPSSGLSPSLVARSIL
ncbi:hypothetical protein ACLOJK_040691 [Asimina triloba]